MSLHALTIVKIGGNIVDNPTALTQFLKDFQSIQGAKILVHGGGKIATELSKTMNITPVMIDGRRVTDAGTLKIVTMVYGGLINKNIVAQLQALGTDAIGLTGADGNIILSHKRKHPTIDYGFVGDIYRINASKINSLLLLGFTPVFAPLTHDLKGNILNTNADSVASEIAIALSDFYQVQFFYCFEKKGVLKDVNNDLTVVREIKFDEFENLKAEGTIAGGMIPKLHNAFEAITKGVSAVYIGKADELNELNNGIFGTKLIS